MATYLLTWNPCRYAFELLAADLEREKQGEPLRWSTGNTKKIRKGDRVFFMAQGPEPRGIFASGHAVSDVLEGDHWRPEREGERAFYVDVKLDGLTGLEFVFPRDLLKQGELAQMHWDAQSSGNLIPSDVAGELERHWAAFLERLGEMMLEARAETPLREGLDELVRAYGAGMGSAEANAAVERAAAEAATAWYTERGWNVESVEAAKVGYDLCCRKGAREEHAVLKGIGGSVIRFFITHREAIAAEEDPEFVLVAVTEALGNARRVHRFSGKKFVGAFELEPLVYRARLRK